MLVNSSRHLLLYDRDCGFCRWSMAWVLRLDRRRALEPLAIQDAPARGLLADLDEDERMASAHLVSPSGERHSGGALAAPTLRLLPGGGAPAALAERIPGVVDAVYRFVARNRMAFGRPVTEGAKRRADALIAARGGPRVEKLRQ